MPAHVPKGATAHQAAGTQAMAKAAERACVALGAEPKSAIHTCSSR
jgi:hypothetical protein